MQRGRAYLLIEKFSMPGANQSTRSFIVAWRASIGSKLARGRGENFERTTLQPTDTQLDSPERCVACGNSEGNKRGRGRRG